MTKYLLSLSFFIFFNALLFSQKGENQYTVNISTGSFVPKQMTDSEIKQQENLTFDGKYFKLIQFYKLPSDSERKKMSQLGLTLVDYLPHFTYFAVIQNSFDWNSISLENVRSVFDVDERFKKEVDIYFRGIPPHAIKNGNYELIVSYYKTLKIQDFLPVLENLGKIVHKNPSVNQLTISISPEQLNNLVVLPFVQFVGAIESDPILEDTKWRQNGRSSYITSGHNGLNYSGAGVKICVGEGGVIGEDNPDFKGRLTENVTSGTSNHKNGVIAREAGAGNVNPKNKGIAFGSDCISTTGGTNYTGLYDSDDLRFTNHSFGWGVQGTYNSGARSRDIFVNTKPSGMISYSAGNNGGSTGYAPYNGFSSWGNITGSPKMSKNNFATASVNQLDALVGFSSKGPAYDGRLMPQIAIEGSGGTSHASPKTIGCLGVLGEVYMDKNGGTEAPSSLLKAVLLNTADDVGNEGIDFRTGFGRINMRRAHNVINNAQVITSAVSNGQTNTHNIVVPSGTVQLKVLIYWADVEASVNAGTALVNDLKLEVTAPNNTSYNPWVLNHSPNSTTLNALPTRQEDHLNNVEQVTLDNPSTGNYTIEVNGDNVPFGPEEYFLVYEFLQNELILTAPTANFKFVPGGNEYIHWDNYGSTADVTLQYQINNGSWNTIATVTHDITGYQWTPPASSSIVDLKIRAMRGSLISESSTGSLGNQANGLQVEWACSDLLKLTWNAVQGATDYQVYALGEKYMEPILTNISYDGTSAIFSGISTTESAWLAVAPKTGTKEGIRSIAIEKTIGDIGNPSFMASIIGETTVCENETEPNIVFTASGGVEPYTIRYNINNGPVQTIVTNGNSTAILSHPTNASGTYVYNLVGVDAGNICSQSITGSVSVLVNPSPIAVIQNDSPQCGGDEITFLATPTGASNYEFFLDNNLNGILDLGESLQSNSSSSFVSSTLTNGDIIGVEVANTEGCLGLSTSATVIYDSFTAFAANNSPQCADENITFAANPIGAANYEFFLDENNNEMMDVGESLQNGNSNIFTSNSLSNGDVIGIVVTSFDNCEELAFSTATLNVSPLLSSANNSPQCEGEPIIVSASSTSAINYDFFIDVNNNGLNDEGESLQNGNSNIFTSNNLSNGDIIGIEVSNANGCKSTSFENITTYTQPIASIIGDATMCEGEMTNIVFTGTPNAEVTYSNGTGNHSIILDQTGLFVLPVSPVSTTVYVAFNVSNNFCSTALNSLVTINVDPLPIAMISAVDTVCSTEEVTLIFTGTPNALVNFTDGINNFNIQLDGFGMYTSEVNLMTSIVYSLQSVSLNNCSSILNSFANVTVLSEDDPACSDCPSDYIQGGNGMLIGVENNITTYQTNGALESIQIIGENAEVDYNAGTSIELQSGFEVILGANFDAFIEGCTIEEKVNNKKKN